MGSLPDILPIFPLPGALLLPRGQLPLHIFEPRYVSMINDALKTQDRLIGMVQPKEDEHVFDVGCAGKITSFEELDDGRFYIVLTGVSRYKIEIELDMKDGYRQVNPAWEGYASDVDPVGCLDLDRDRLKDVLGNYLSMHEIDCDWSLIEKAPDEKLITCLSMICPFDPNEKQALLEAKCCNARAEMFLTMLDMAIRSGAEPNKAMQH